MEVNMKENGMYTQISAMVVGTKSGATEVFTRATGGMIKQTGEEDSSMQMVISMTDTGVKTKPMALVNIHTLMELCIKEIG